MVLVGEAWGKDEEEKREPFVGASGRMLNGILHSVGIDRRECFVTNVFNLRPQPTNDIKNLCGPKAEGIKGMPQLQSGKYVRAEYASEIERLYRELEVCKPNVIVALGATPAWALLHKTPGFTSGIKKIRGAPLQSHLGYKVLPTYHPAAIMREFKLRPVVIADLTKAKREAEYPEVRRPLREIWIEPTLDDLSRFEREYIEPASYLSVDIETIGRQITCIGFAPENAVALVVPFYSKQVASGNYWRTNEDERAAWEWVKRVLQLKKKFVFQNGLYDMRFLWEIMGITVPHAEDDTMLLHHALQPEMEKGLGFLGSIYSDEAQWKFMRKNETVKKED